MRQQAGFTLIELIMVIVILGILAAFALPRFANLSTDARVASLNGLTGSVRSAMNIAHQVQLVRNSGVNADITLEGGQVVRMRNGFPRANTAGIGAAVDLSGFTSVGGGNGANARIRYRFEDAPSATCQLQYRAANGTTRLIPDITLTTSGC